MRYGRKQALKQWRGLFTGPICNLAWLFTGAALQRFFEKYERPINIVMAVSLFYCAFSLIWGVAR